MHTYSYKWLDFVAGEPAHLTNCHVPSLSDIGKQTNHTAAPGSGSSLSEPTWLSVVSKKACLCLNHISLFCVSKKRHRETKEWRGREKEGEREGERRIERNEEIDRNRETETVR